MALEGLLEESKMPPTSGSEASLTNQNEGLGSEVNIEAIGDDVKNCNNAMTTLVQIFSERACPSFIATIKNKRFIRSTDLYAL